MTAAIPITLLTGYLGSGKTTLLARLLAHPELEDTAVLVNEFGEIALDHQLLYSAAESIVLLEPRLSVLRAAQRSRRAAGRALRAAHARGDPALQARRDRDDRPCRPGTDPANPGGRADAGRSVSAGRRVTTVDGELGEPGARRALRIGQAGGARRSHRDHQGRPGDARNPGHRSKRGCAS